MTNDMAVDFLVSHGARVQMDYSRENNARRLCSVSKLWNVQRRWQSASKREVVVLESTA